MLARLFISALLIFASLTFPSTAISSGVAYYISPSGSDSSSGLSLTSPFKTIQKAVDAAEPGDTIRLSAGEYRQDIVSRRNGRSSSPITITGPAEAVVKGGGSDRIIEINHDYLTLSGFTVDGFYGSTVSSSSYRDKLIFVLGKEIRNGVTGLKVLNMTLRNAGGECLRLRYFVTQAEIAYNTIKNCGVYDFVFHNDGKNGEGIYMGTSSKQWSDGKNPTSDPDETRDNHVHHNEIDTQGNECVDLKEGTTANLIEYNNCRGQKDPESGGLDSRGDGNIFRSNSIKGNLGTGIRLGGWLVKNIQYGKNNDVYNNIIENNEGGGIRFQVSPQAKVCGNQFSGNLGEDSVGNYASMFNPANPCAGSPTPTPPSISPTPPSSTPLPTITPSIPHTPPPSSVPLTITPIFPSPVPLIVAPGPPSALSPPPTIASSIAPSLSPSVLSPPNTHSLANSKTLVASSSNFSDGYDPARLWDGCYEGILYDSTTCTTGGRNISSFWLEFDLGKPYTISQARLYGDAVGTWVSESWTLEFKQNAKDNWVTVFSNENALFNTWLSHSLNLTARYIRLKVSGNKRYSPGRTQAREFEVYGVEVILPQGITPNYSQSQNGLFPNSIGPSIYLTNRGFLGNSTLSFGMFTKQAVTTWENANAFCNSCSTWPNFWQRLLGTFSNLQL